MNNFSLAIDALPAMPGKSGAVGAFRNIIRLVPTLYPSIKLHLFVNSSQLFYYKKYIPKATLDLIKIHKIYFPISNRLCRIGIQNTWIPQLCRHNNIKVHYSMNPEPFFNMSNTAEVFSVVDLQYYDLPGEFNPVKVNYRKWMGEKKVSRSKLVIANSQYTKKKILQYFNVEPEKVKVVYEALDHTIFNTADYVKDPKTNILKKYNITKPFIIYVSSFRPYKNHLLLLEAYNKIISNDKHHDLVLVGNDINDYRRVIQKRIIDLSIFNRVKIFDYIHHNDLKDFYRSASVAVYLSDNETFGIPPLEAMACGVPVIISDQDAVVEVSGGGAIIVDPRDTDNLASTIINVINDDNLSSKMIMRGKEWCKRYSWLNNITELISNINEVV